VSVIDTDLEVMLDISEETETERHNLEIYL